MLDRVRENLDWRVPILFITQRNSESHIVKALQQGADDYVDTHISRLRRKLLLASDNK